MIRSQLFIAHSTDDALWRERLATMLAPLVRIGVSFWDETQIQPGQHRQGEIATALGNARVAVLLVSPAFLASEFVLDQALSTLLAAGYQEQKLKILWVVVKPCLWQQTELVSYQPAHDPSEPLSTLTDSEADAALVAICQRIRSAVNTDNEGIGAAPAGNPYRGLSAFQLDEAPLFFGREALTEKLWQRFKALYEQSDATRLLAILGPSGSGKSSVARAGLLAALGGRPVPGPQALRRVMLKPGKHPLRSLVMALRPLFSDKTSSPDLGAQRKLIDDLSQSSQRGEFDGLTLWAANLEGVDTRPVVVLVDQFEEVYTLCVDKAERDAFTGLLLHAASDSARHVSIVLTLRSDFLGETQRQHPELNRLVVEQEVLVGSMSREDLRQAIAKPAQQAGHPIDDVTIDLLLTQAQGSEGTLPLLEFALTRLWEGMGIGKSPGLILQEIGGVGGALAGKAKEIYDALSATEQPIARRALVLLVQLGEGTRDTRRQVPIRELCGRGETEPGVLNVLRKFATENARLVTLSGDGEETVAEVTHEALFDHWSELRQWIDESRADRPLHDRIAEAAQLWEEDQKPPGRLWRPPDLDLLRDYLKRKPADLSDQAIRFLNAAEEQERQEQRNARRTQLQTRGATVGLVVSMLVGMGAWAVQASYIAKEQSLRATEAQRQLQKSYMEQGRQRLLAGDTLRALAWLNRAYQAGLSDPALPYLLRQAAVPLDALLLSLEGHKDVINAASFSPDGSRVITADSSGTALLWDAQAGKQLVQLNGHQKSLTGATFSPDGHTVLTASLDSTAKLWNVEQGTCVQTFDGHENGLNGAVYGPQNKIITYGGDRAAKVWDAGTGRLLWTLMGHTGAILTVIASFRTGLAVTGSADSTAKVWDVNTGRLVSTLSGHTQRVTALAFSPDASLVATGSGDGTVRLWGANQGQLVATLGPHDLMISDVHFSPDGKLVVSASYDGIAKIWDLASGRVVSTLAGHTSRIYSAQFSDDSRFVITASADKSAKIWNPRNGQLFQSLDGHGDSVWTAQISRDSKFALTAGADLTAKLWKIDPLLYEGTLSEHGGAVTSVAYSPDGHWVATGSANGQVSLWDPASGALIQTLVGHNLAVSWLSFSASGSALVSAGLDKVAIVWDLRTGKRQATLAGHTGVVQVAATDSDGRHVLTASLDKTAKLWDIKTGASLFTLRGHSSAVVAAAFSPDGNQIATASWDGTAKLWDAKTSLDLLTLRGHQARLYSVSFSPNGDLLLTAGADRTARLWDVRTGQVISTLAGHGGAVNVAKFSPDGRLVATASEDKTAKLWRVSDGQLVASLEGHVDGVNTVAFSPDSERLVTASEDGECLLWDTRSGNQIGTLQGHSASVLDVAFSPDGTHVATASGDSTAVLWRFAPEQRSREKIAELVRCRVPYHFIGDALLPERPDTLSCQPPR